MITYTEFMGEQAVLLENEFLRAVILPERGGKAASLFCKETGMEILYQNRKGKFSKAEFGSDFSKYEACGFDDAFPNVDAEEVEINRKMISYPDHGEIWSASFECEIGTVFSESMEEPGSISVKDAEERECLQLFYHSRRLNYDYHKIFWLEGKRLCCSYWIRNGGQCPLPCIWTMHCLVNTTPGMRLIFPSGTTRVQNVFTSRHLGQKEEIYPYPQAEINGKRYRFDRLPEDDMVKYYVVGKVTEDGCGYDYPETGTAVRFFYDTEKLPYLGCWITAGGYRGEKNCALEPCSGYYDSVGTAGRLGGGCPEIGPEETFWFSMEIEVTSLINIKNH